MAGGWVNVRGYTSGKRHYYPDATITESESDPDQHGRINVYQKIAGFALCREKVDGYKTSRGFTRYTNRNGKVHDGWGAFSVVENPNLMQRNLCAYCLKKFFKEIRPDLLPVYEAMKSGLRAN